VASYSERISDVTKAKLKIVRTPVGCCDNLEPHRVSIASGPRVLGIERVDFLPSVPIYVVVMMPVSAAKV
jgi:hypothetical protein